MINAMLEVVMSVVTPDGLIARLLRSWSRWTCRHKLWLAQEPIVSDLEDGVQSVTWQRMVCERCHKVRNQAMLKPGEEVVVEWELSDGGDWYA